VLRIHRNGDHEKEPVIEAGGPHPLTPRNPAMVLLHSHDKEKAQWHTNVQAETQSSGLAQSSWLWPDWRF
jgi:hypothetical protein